MTLTLWLSLLGICFLGAASPGPSLAVILRIALRSGLREGLLAAWGHAAAIGFYALLSVVFYTGARASGGAIFWSVSLLGQLWLLYLGGRMLQAALGGSTANADGQDDTAARWFQGLIIGLFNPKIWLFFTAVFSPFVAAIDDPLPLALVPFIIDGSWYTLVVIGVTHGRLAQLLQRSRRPMDGALGTALIILGLIALTETLPALIDQFATV